MDFTKINIEIVIHARRGQKGDSFIVVVRPPETLLHHWCRKYPMPSAIITLLPDPSALMVIHYQLYPLMN